MTLGICFAVASALLFALGNAFQKRGVDGLPRFTVGGLRSALVGIASSPPWLAGAGLSAGGLVCQVGAFHYLSLSIAQSVGVLSVVFLLVISKLHFGETWRPNDIAGIGTAIVGGVLVGLSVTPSSSAAGKHPHLEMLIFALAGTVAVIGAFNLRRASRGHTAFTYAASAGLLYGIASICTKGISTLFRVNDVGSSVARILSSGYPYLFLMAWIGALLFFQFGIQREGVGVVGSISSLVTNAYVVVIGTPVFGEHFPVQPDLLAFRVAGLVAIVVGSSWVAWGNSGSARPEAVPLAKGAGRSGGTIS